MRQGQQNNNKQRMRGRNRKGPNPLTRSYESNGPDVKIRGTALHIAEKYMQLARDAQSSGDRVAGESYLQHAEHYYRIVAAAQAQMPQQAQTAFRNDEDGDDDEQTDRGSGYDNGQAYRQQSAFGLGEPQPFLNGNGEAQPDGEVAIPATQPEENRFEPRPPNREGAHGGFRQRRRRPFRERYGEPRDAAGGGGNEETAAGVPRAPATEVAPSDD